MPGIIISNITSASDNFDDMSEEEYIEEVLDAIVSYTPVDTGVMQSGWYVDGDDIVNDIDYTSYQELGTEFFTGNAGFVEAALASVEADADVSEY